MGDPLTVQGIIDKAVASIAEGRCLVAGSMWWLGHALEASGARWRRREDRDMNGGEEGGRGGCGAHGEGRRGRVVAFMYQSS